jgi:hypothetical protein
MIDIFYVVLGFVLYQVIFLIFTDEILDGFENFRKKVRRIFGLKG